MRTSGLPCRATPDCEVVFRPARGDSMEALHEAAALRDAHEAETHAYRHEVRAVPGATPFSQSGGGSRGRRRPRELTTA